MSKDFLNMRLPEPVLKALHRMKFETPTPIQQEAIPLARDGRDIIGCAQTGTGKTAAFCIPLVSKLLENPTAGALVLAPTRELALQISDVLRKLTVDAPQLRVALLIGGSDMFRQIRDLKQKPAIIVATPGRLNDHLKRRSANLSRVEVVVLDEGDRMLDMGFEPQIVEILKHVKEERQTMLFSATMPAKIKRLASRYLKNPASISVGNEAKPVDQIKHTIVQTARDKKQDVLLDQLNTREGSILIFVNTQRGTDRLTDHLEEFGYAVSRIHGGRSQGQRNSALSGFRSGKFRILVATDVAARGLDVPQIAHVINFELPRDIDDYVHRIGRTARAGAEGDAICLLAPEERGIWNRIAHLYNLEKVAGGAKDKGGGRRDDRSRGSKSARSGDRGGGDRSGPRGPRPEGRGPRPERRDSRPERGPRPESRGSRPENRGPRAESRGPNERRRESFRDSRSENRKDDRGSRPDNRGPQLERNDFRSGSKDTRPESRETRPERGARPERGPRPERRDSRPDKRGPPKDGDSTSTPWYITKRREHRGVKASKHTGKDS